MLLRGEVYDQSSSSPTIIKNGFVALKDMDEHTLNQRKQQHITSIRDENFLVHNQLPPPPVLKNELMALRDIDNTMYQGIRPSAKTATAAHSDQNNVYHGETDVHSIDEKMLLKDRIDHTIDRTVNIDRNFNHAVNHAVYSNEKSSPVSLSTTKQLKETSIHSDPLTNPHTPSKYETPHNPPPSPPYISSSSSKPHQYTPTTPSSPTKSKNSTPNKKTTSTPKSDILTLGSEISTPKSNIKKFIGSNKKLKQNLLNFEDIAKTKTAATIYNEVMNYDSRIGRNKDETRIDSVKNGDHNYYKLDDNCNNDYYNNNKNYCHNDNDDDNHRDKKIYDYSKEIFHRINDKNKIKIISESNHRNDEYDYEGSSNYELRRGMDSQQKRVRDWLDRERENRVLGEGSCPQEVHSPSSERYVSTGTPSGRTPLQKGTNYEMTQKEPSRTVVSTSSSGSPLDSSLTRVTRGAWTEERRALSDRAILAALLRAQEGIDRNRKNNTSNSNLFSDINIVNNGYYDRDKASVVDNRRNPNIHDQKKYNGHKDRQPYLPEPEPEFDLRESMLPSTEKLLMDTGERMQRKERKDVYYRNEKNEKIDGIRKVDSSMASVYFRNEVAGFGCVAVGSNAKLKVELCNSTNEKVTMYVSDSPLPFVFIHNEITINAKAFVKVPVRFVPISGPQEFHTRMFAQSADGRFQAEIKLFGSSRWS